MVGIDVQVYSRGGSPWLSPSRSLSLNLSVEHFSILWWSFCTECRTNVYVTLYFLWIDLCQQDFKITKISCKITDKCYTYTYGTHISRGRIQVGQPHICTAPLPHFLVSAPRDLRWSEGRLINRVAVFDCVWEISLPPLEIGAVIKLAELIKKSLKLSYLSIAVFDYQNRQNSFFLYIY